MDETRVSVYVQLYKVGDFLYKVSRDKITKIMITDIRKYPHIVYRDNNNTSYFNRSIVKSCFKTYEEAEQELERQRNIKKKREMMKEYERKLNEELNISNHFIVK